MIEVRKATCQRGGRQILEAIDLTVTPGRFTCLVGPNGSGKTSLLRLIGGVWAPDSGAVDLDAANIETWSRRDIARRIAWVPQQTRLRFDFTVAEVVGMGRYPHEGRLSGGRDAAHPAVRAALERADVAHLSDRLVTTLSGGESQRVLLARCLATEAETLLLDEPTSALDLKHALEVMRLCRSLAAEGRSVVAAVHDLSAAVRWADEVIVMADGRIAAAGGPREVLTPALLLDVFGVRAHLMEGPNESVVFVLSEDAPGA